MQHKQLYDIRTCKDSDDIKFIIMLSYASATYQKTIMSVTGTCLLNVKLQ